MGIVAHSQEELGPAEQLALAFMRTEARLTRVIAKHEAEISDRSGPVNLVDFRLYRYAKNLRTQCRDATAELLEC